LEHCERALSHSQPAYLTYLRIQTEVTKNTVDKALVVLSVIAIADIAMNLTRAFASMNVNVPASKDFSIFGIMCALSITVGCTIAGLARFWWVKSHRRRGRLQAAG
jgi:magnesium transporter